MVETYRFGFVMARVAGHATHIDNLHRVAAEDPDIEPIWHDISSYRAGGLLERVTDRAGRGQSLRPVIDVLGQLRWRRIDAVFANTGIVAAYPRRIRTCPIVIDFDSTPTQLAAMVQYGRSRRSTRRGRVRDRWLRALWSDVAVFHAWSQWAKASAVDDFGIAADRVVVNPPGVDVELWRPSDDVGRPGGPRRIVFVGGDFERKGGDLLVEWFRRHRPRDTELHLVTRADVEPSAGITVHRDLTANSGRLVDLVRSCDVFALPSRAECFGIATIEAMAAGLPVVIGDTGAGSEIVGHEDNGFLVRPDQVDEIGGAIATLLDDESLRRRMALRSREIAELRFDLRANAGTTMQILKNATDGIAPST